MGGGKWVQQESLIGNSIRSSLDSMPASFESRASTAAVEEQKKGEAKEAVKPIDLLK